MKQSPTKHCASCGARLAGPFCSACGERARRPGDVSLRRYLAEFFDAAFNLDSRFWRSVGALLFRPGLLTSEYMDGRRVNWMRPLHLFLLVNLIFFLFSGGWNTFTTPLQLHMTASGFPHQSLASDWVNRHLNDPALEDAEWSEIVASIRGSDVELDESGREVRDRLVDYTRDFNRRADITARSLLIALVPLYTVFPLLVFCRRRESPVKHLVFATHGTAVILLVVWVGGWSTITATSLGLIDSTMRAQDIFSTSITLTLLWVWSLFAFRRAYDLGWLGSVLAALGLMIWFAVFIQLYRALLFFVVFWSG